MKTSWMLVLSWSLLCGVLAACSDETEQLSEPSSTTQQQTSTSGATTQDVGGDATESDASTDVEVDALPDTPEDTTETRSDEEIVADWLTGDFNSRAQSQRDRRYFDVHLYAVRIFSEEPDGFWMYVQQSRDDDDDGTYEDPYRQRVYHVLANATGERVVSTVYRIDDEARFIDPWDDPSVLDALEMDDLDEATGCAVTLTREDAESFTGGTRPTSCRLSFGGYVTSSVTMRASSFSSLDLIYDDDGVIVNGLTPESDPYSFVKTENFSLDP